MQGFSRTQLAAAGVAVAMALVGSGMLVAKSATRPSSPITISTALAAPQPIQASDASQPTVTVTQTVCVHVAGRVKKPGVYKLPAGSRVCDALKAASGPLPNADVETINLAERLTDGVQVYVAAKGEVEPPKTSVIRGRPDAGTTARTGDHEEASAKSAAKRSKADTSPKKLTSPGSGTIHINSAGELDLQRLPGIGPAMARRIVEYRKTNGGFKSVDGLDAVKGIGPAKLAKLKPFVAL